MQRVGSEPIRQEQSAGLAQSVERGPGNSGISESYLTKETDPSLRRLVLMPLDSRCNGTPATHDRIKGYLFYGSSSLPRNIPARHHRSDRGIDKSGVAPSPIFC